MDSYNYQEIFNTLTRQEKQSVGILTSYLQKSNPEIEMHQQRVSFLAVKISQEIYAPNNNFTTEIKNTYLSSRLHDIGYIFKMRNNYNLRRELFGETDTKAQAHTNLGQLLVKEENIGTEIEKIILQHHEYQNGKGCYGLTKDEIHPLAPIVGLADYVDNQCNTTTLTKPKSLEQVSRQLLIQAQDTFSLPVIEGFLKAWKTQERTLQKWYSTELITRQFYMGHSLKKNTEL